MPVFWSVIAACTHDRPLSETSLPEDIPVDEGDDTPTTPVDLPEAVGLDTLAPGDLLLSEIMNKPDQASDDYGEWLELYNATDQPIDLDGLIVTAVEAELSFVLPELRIEPSSYVVLVRDADAMVNGGVLGQFDYRTDLDLSSDHETLQLSFDSVVLDTVSYDDRAWFPDDKGASMSLDPAHQDASDNDLGQFWCPSRSAYGEGDRGTPGKPGDPCPDLQDSDSDGWVAAHDCDDSAPSIHPDAPETARDDLDQDCDGSDGHADDLQPGDLVITEIMNNPSFVDDDNGEWFEIYNASSFSFDLEGLEVQGDPLNPHEVFVLDAPLPLPAGAYLVFAADPDPEDNGGLPLVDYDYPGSNFGLSNSADQISLRAQDRLIDRVIWDAGIAFPAPLQGSMMLDDDALSSLTNDQGVHWCPSLVPIGQDPGQDFGTPGGPNGQCL